jgi:hypothetical protein
LVDEGWGGAGCLPRAEHVRVPEWVVLILAVAADMAHVDRDNPHHDLVDKHVM